jgi:peptide/nickel transport system permease protein
VANGQNYPNQWWLTIFPGLLIVLIVLCVNFVGDGLRDALDPQQRRVRA